MKGAIHGIETDWGVEPISQAAYDAIKKDTAISGYQCWSAGLDAGFQLGLVFACAAFVFGVAVGIVL